MTNKDFMQSLTYIRGLLYRCPFSGDQMMVASECVRVLDATLSALNERPIERDTDKKSPSEEQEG